MNKAVQKGSELLHQGTQLLPVAVGASAAFGKSLKKNLKKARQKKKGEITMKKSTLVALLVFLSAIAGALAAAYFYLARREKELDEYEQMLFSEDYADTDDDDGSRCEPASEEPAE